MIIKSLLSQDFYKLTMNNVFWRGFPDATAKYRFKCRNDGVDLRPFKEEIAEELDALCELRFTDDEIDWVSQFSYFGGAFLDYLEDFRLKRRYIEVEEKDDKLDIVMEGLLTNVSMDEKSQSTNG